MKGDNVDKHIATFGGLRHCAGVSPDDTVNLRSFAPGLPLRLAESRIDIEVPRPSPMGYLLLGGSRKTG
jgi:hypothetical protein